MNSDIAKAILSNADGIINAIDQYIMKADDELKKTLANEGYADAKSTVDEISDLEEQIASALQEQTESFVDEIGSGDDWDAARKRISALFDNDNIAETVSDVVEDMFTATVPGLATIYMQESDGKLVVDTLRKRTSNWISSWSAELGKLTKINTHQQITALIEDTIAEGKSIDDLTSRIREGGWRNEYYQAKRFAVTEVLRAHSVAHEEAIQQSPVVDMKEWRHTGSHKNKPRPNHVAMDGQVVAKDEPFVLNGKNGTTYYPMYPRDSILPAEETVNCHCIHRGIVNDDILGRPVAERKKMQQDYVNADNNAWEKSIDAENKQKAGISVDDENEESKPKVDNDKAVIDRKAIAAADYRTRFDALGENKKTVRSVCAKSREMLRHRSGTDYEDLAFIDSRTGKSLINKAYNVKHKARPNKAMNKMLKDAEENTIIGVHNHPNSPVPSISDLEASRQRKYKFGLAVGHDGSIYKYNVTGELNYPMVENGLDLLQGVKYIEDADEISKALGEALKVLKDGGVEMEVL